MDLSLIVRMQCKCTIEASTKKGLEDDGKDGRLVHGIIGNFQLISSALYDRLLLH